MDPSPDMLLALAREGAQHYNHLYVNPEQRTPEKTWRALGQLAQSFRELDSWLTDLGALPLDWRTAADGTTRKAS